MAIQKQVVWDVANNKYSGFIDQGPLETKEILASEALVFQLVGIGSHWKQPIGYFLTDKMPAATQASLVNMALIMASNAGLEVWCGTCDGEKIHWKCFHSFILYKNNKGSNLVTNCQQTTSSLKNTR